MRSAMILAAGLGTRLRPLTEELPKPLVPVGDAPAIVQIQRYLATQGIRHIVVNSHHRADAFASVVWPLSTEILYESTILGTAGGVANARAHVAEEESLLVWNGDILANIDISALFAALPGALAAWSVAPRPAGQGTVGLDLQGRVVRLRSLRCGNEVRGGDFLGVQVISRALLESLPATGCMVGDVLVPMLEQGARIQAVDHVGMWDDIGSLSSYLSANLRWLGDRTFYAGSGTRVNAPLKQVILGAGATVKGGLLSRVILWPGASVEGPLQNAIVTTAGQVVFVEVMRQK